jgi:adenylate kinase family enzyme
VRKILILGNSGSGKSTLAQTLKAAEGLGILDLDTIAWREPAVRRDPDDTFNLLRDFIGGREGWVIEGCYGSLIQRATAFCTELIFLDPGVEVCLANNRQRPWEPHKYDSKEAQDAGLDFLQQWVRDYYTRDDECSHRRHTQVYESYTGDKARIREL